MFYAHSSSRASSGQLESLSSAREREREQLQRAASAAVDDDGALLEFAALELRVHPPNVRIDNSHSDHTVLIIDSANRPGTLVEVVQCLTELGLSVRQARISSDGGWFVDEFHVSETPTGRVTDPAKIDAIRKVLSVQHEPQGAGEPPEEIRSTVFQLAGPETPGLLAEVTQLLTHNGMEIRTAAAWTFHGRAALVIGVTENSATVHDSVKLQRLRELLQRLVERSGGDDAVVVSVEQVEGPIHHERRLHQLLLADEVKAWKQLSRLQRQHSLPFPGPISTHVAADTGAAADQLPSTPSTPQQQWQRQMLPPSWTVERGKPMIRDDKLELAILQQRQQQEEQQRQQHEEQQQQQQQPPDAPPASQHDQAPTRASGAGAARQAPALPMASSAAAADAAAVSAAAAAATHQASVDKLIALLQPHSLVHAASLPPASRAGQTGPAGPASVDAPDTPGAAAAQQQQQAPGAAEGSAAAAALPNSASSAGPTDAAAQTALLRASTAATHALTLLAAGSGDPHTASAAAGAAACAVGLPPRAPAHAGGYLVSACIAPPAGVTAAAAGAVDSASGRPAAASLSAPCSPCMLPAKAAAAAGSSGAAADGATWSPGRHAGSCAAGLLSPRGLPGTAGCVGGAHSMLGLAPQLQSQGGGAFAPGGSIGGLDTPEVSVQHSSAFNYWLVSVHCRNRNKLLFDTVCTLCDLRFDIYHATIDSLESGQAAQLFYVRPRFGDSGFDDAKAAQLRAMLARSVQRRFPPGLRVHIFAGDALCIQELASSMRRHRLTITRCKVRAYDNGSHTFSLLNHDGTLPSRQHVQMACQAAGGELVEAPPDVNNACVATVLRSLAARGRFAFSFASLRAGQHASAPRAQHAARAAALLAPEGGGLQLPGSGGGGGGSFETQPSF